MKRILAAGCALAAVCVFSGCHLEAYVTDQSNIETYIKNVSLCGDKYITVASGGAVQSVPLESVTRIVVANEENKTINGQLYFCASVEFRDGTKLDAKNKSNTPLTYINTTGTLCGDSQKGHYTIGLANVSKVIIKGN
jgi:hypothetical protein